MISTRYAIPTLIALVLALIPTILHSYIGAKHNDGKSAHNISATLGHFTSTPSRRNKQWGKNIFASDDWFERIYQSRENKNIRLFVARSYDQKRLYHHPELALSYGKDFTKKSITFFPDKPGIPVYLLSNDDNSMIVAYILMYDNTFIENPIMHQFSESLRLLVGNKKPMTLFYASQSDLLPETNFSQSASATILSLAIESFESQNGKI